MQLNDGFFYYYLQRGLLAERMGDVATAHQDLMKSAKLLPTADAFNALGNIARREGEVARATQYYERAAQSKSPAGKSAFAALVELDLPKHPGKYLKVRTGITKRGHLIAELSNPTPHDVRAVVVAVRYPTSGGKMREGRKAYRGRLRSGTKVRMDLGSGFPQDAGHRIRGAIVAAEIVK